MQVDEKKNPPKSNYQGTQYNFCGQECKEKFDRSPQQYIGQGQQAGQGQQSGQGQQPGQGQQTRQSGGGGAAGGGA
jgi:YHS domain-containing protein